MLLVTCRDMVEDTARKDTGNLFPTDLGRVASHFYISFNTVQIVNERLTDNSDLKSVLEIISMSQVRARRSSHG